MTCPHRLILLLIGTAWSSLAGACHAPPITVHAGDDCVRCAALCSNSDLWRFGADDQPVLPAGSRVAILECSVEFVTMKQVTPGARQAIVGGPYSPLSALTEISGVFRKRVSYPPRVREIVPDEKGLISQRLAAWCDGGEIDLVLTTGGTGLGPRDVTPEATMEVIEFQTPGISEAIRIQTLQKTPLAMLSRSVAGVRSGCLIINLPGSPTGVRECLEVAVPAIPHALEMLKGWRGHPAH